MIKKESFVQIMNTLDEFYNGEIAEAFDKLGIYECKFSEHMDVIVNAIDEAVDPECFAEEDENTIDSGSYICDWLFGIGKINEICPTAEELYDYIVNKYLKAVEDDR